MIDAKEDKEEGLKQGRLLDLFQRGTHAASILQVGTHVRGIFLRPIVTKKNERALYNSIQKQGTAVYSSHNNQQSQYQQGHKTFHRRHLIWSQYFSGLHLPTMALYNFCDQSQKMSPPPPPDPDPPSGAKIISIPDYK